MYAFQNSLVCVLMILTVFLSCRIFAAEANHNELIKIIIKGHTEIDAGLQNITGSILRFSGDVQDRIKPFDINGLKQDRNIRFHRFGEMYRLDFVGIPVQQDHPDDIERILIGTPTLDYLYQTLSSTGSPFANVSEFKSPAKEVRIPLQHDFLWPVSSLTTLTGGNRIIDLLQNKISSVETKPFKDIQDAVWINFETQNSKFQIILSPSELYRLVYYKIGPKNEEVILESWIQSARFFDKILCPTEIESVTRSTTILSKRNLFRITIDSISSPDLFLFQKETFKELKRDYVVLSENEGKPVLSNEVIVVPTNSHSESGRGFPMNQPETKFNKSIRLFFIFIGNLVLLLAIYYFFLSRKKQKNSTKNENENN